jgi:hypothetical protein
MDAVGNAATSSKKDAGMGRGKQVLTEANIRPSENGGFTVEQRYRQDSKGGDGPSPYIEPKTFTFESFDSMVAHLATELGGAPAKAATPPPDNEMAEGEPPPPPPPAQRPPMPLEDSGMFSGVARG